MPFLVCLFENGTQAPNDARESYLRVSLLCAYKVQKRGVCVNEGEVVQMSTFSGHE